MGREVKFSGVSSKLLLVTLATLGLSCVATASSSKDPCTAGVVFLRTFAHTNDLTPPPPPSSEEPSTLSPSQQQRNNTYVIQISYPCDGSPLGKIEKLRERIKDPFVSFYLKKHRSVKRVKRLSEYGSGDYDDDDDDDNEDDDDEEEDGEEDDVDVQMQEFGKSVEPSNHVVVLLPTPSLMEVDNVITVDSTPSSRYQVPPELTSSVVLESIAPTRSYYPTHSYRPSEDDNLLFPNLGSGDGPAVMTTPIYNPTDQTYMSSSSSSSRPEYVSSFTPTPELRAHLMHPIPKQMIVSGVQHKLVIPLNTFQPPCYEYELVENENWVDVRRNVVRFFPVTAHISDYTMHLGCKDHGGVADMFVSVRQRQKSRVHNHAFVLEFGMIRGNHSRVEVLGKLVEEVRAVLGGTGGVNGSDIVVLSTELDTYPFRVSYVNESIVSNVCPVEEMKRIYEKLQGINGFVKMESVKVTLPPDNNQCEPGVVSVVTGEKQVVGYGENYQPSIKNQIDRLNGSVGEYLVFGVREDFCYDPEDGGTRNLKVELRTSELSVVPEEYWLQFDGKNQEFYGLPMEEVAQKEFVLVCSDRGGKSANDVLELQITPPRVPLTTYNAEFSLHFQSIPFTPKAIRKFIEKLSSVLSPEIHVHSYSESNNHVLFKWYNTSNPSSEHEVTEIRKVLLSDDGPVNKRLAEHFSPEFNVTVASVVPLRGMLSENNPVDPEGKGGGKGEDGGGTGGRYFDFESIDHDKERGGGGGMGSSGGGGDKKIDLDRNVEGVANVDNYSGYLTTYIIPSVLIAVMILLALIIACLLSRKNKYTQASTEDDSPNARVYLKNAKKGVPVIFQDELDEKLFGGQAPGAAQAGHRGNIYEPPLPRSGTGTPHTHHAPPQRNDSSSAGMQSPRVISPQPNHPSRGYQNPPPDYQNSISRSMMRNRGPLGGMSSPPPIGGVPVFPNQHLYDRTPQHHGHHGGGGHHQQQIDSYAPPPGISMYGIHNSNSGSSGFSGGGPYVSGGNPPHHHHQQHHHHGGNNSNKMAPPPYVPP